jgi:hypothetical protein
VSDETDLHLDTIRHLLRQLNDLPRTPSRSVDTHAPEYERIATLIRAEADAFMRLIKKEFPDAE